MDESYVRGLDLCWVANCGLCRAFNPSATAAMSAATPYTMLSSQYLLAPSMPPRKMPWEGLIAPWNKVAISTLPSVWRKPSSTDCQKSARLRRLRRDGVCDSFTP